MNSQEKAKVLKQYLSPDTSSNMKSLGSFGLSKNGNGRKGGRGLKAAYPLSFIIPKFKSFNSPGLRKVL